MTDSTNGKVVYICAAARSGSTVLDMLLGAHSEVASLGEFSFLGKAVSLDQQCSCGSSVRTCGSWGKVFERIRLDWQVDVRNDPYALWQWDTRADVVIDHVQQTPRYLAARKLRSAYCQFRWSLPAQLCKVLKLPNDLEAGSARTLRLYKIIREEWGKSVVVDSSKNILKALALYEKSPETVRIILLTRDGRGTFFSRRCSGFSHKSSLYGWAHYYKMAFRLLPKWVKPEHLLILKYEDVASATRETMIRATSLVGISFEETMLNLGRGEHHLPDGNDMRFSKSLAIRLDERWKDGLKDGDLDYFMRYGARLNAKLGYAD